MSAAEQSSIRVYSQEHSGFLARSQRLVDELLVRVTAAHTVCRRRRRRALKLCRHSAVCLFGRKCRKEFAVEFQLLGTNVP